MNSLTIVRLAEASICPNRRVYTNPDTLDGLPGGCTNRGSPSDVNQYSSSHSVGSARSKLGSYQRGDILQRFWLTLRREWSMADQSQSPSSIPTTLGSYRTSRKSQSGRFFLIDNGTYQKARRHNSSSTFSVGEYIFLRCAPTSSAARTPAPTTVHVPCGAVVSSRNKAISYSADAHCDSDTYSPVGGAEITYCIDLKVIQLRRRKGEPLRPLDIAEPLPPRRMWMGRAGEKYTWVPSEPRPDRAHQQDSCAKAAIA